MEFGQQPPAHQNHDGAQYDGTNDANHENPLLKMRGNSKVSKDQQKDKNIIDSQGLFNQIACQKFK